MSERIPPTKRGRPKKELILSKKAGSRGVVGRPPGDAERIREYKARLLAAPTADRIISKFIDIAMDDKHPGQMAAMKMAIDRILPASIFDKDREGNRPSINIMISGIDTPTVSAYNEDNTIDIEPNDDDGEDANN